MPWRPIRGINVLFRHLLFRYVVDCGVMIFGHRVFRRTNHNDHLNTIKGFRVVLRQGAENVPQVDSAT